MNSNTQKKELSSISYRQEVILINEKRKGQNLLKIVYHMNMNALYKNYSLILMLRNKRMKQNRKLRNIYQILREPRIMRGDLQKKFLSC